MKYPTLALIALLPMAVLATEKHEPQPDPTATAEAFSESSQTQTAESLSDSVSSAESFSENSQNQVAEGGRNAIDVDSLALALPGKTPATRVVTECHESNAKFSVLGSGPGARVTLNADCVRFRQCMERAEFYARLGREALALEQVESCGGVPAPDESAACERESRIEAACLK